MVRSRQPDQPPWRDRDPHDFYSATKTQPIIRRTAELTDIVDAVANALQQLDEATQARNRPDQLKHYLALKTFRNCRRILEVENSIRQSLWGDRMDIY